MLVRVYFDGQTHELDVSLDESVEVLRFQVFSLFPELPLDEQVLTWLGPDQLVLTDAVALSSLGISEVHPHLFLLLLLVLLVLLVLRRRLFLFFSGVGDRPPPPPTHTFSITHIPVTWWHTPRRGNASLLPAKARHLHRLHLAPRRRAVLPVVPRPRRGLARGPHKRT
jgi:hypothetical protein